MSTAAHLRKVYVKATNAAPSGSDELDGAKEFSFTTTRDVLDTTDFKDGDQRTKMLGLKDGSGSISGDWEPADAIQTILRNAHLNGTLVYVTDLQDGTTGATYPVLVESIENGGAVGDLVSSTFNITQAGAAIARP
jgi:hypothetical protein